MSTEDFSQTMTEVRAAQAGDDAAMDSLFRRFLPRVVRIVAARTGQHWKQLGLDDDLVQQTLMDAYVAIREGRVRNEAAFTSWVATCVATNLVDADRLSKRAKRGGARVTRFADLDASMLSESMMEGDLATPSQIATARESEERLEQALSGVSDRYREVIVLRAYCRMSYAEIAAEMDLPSANTANALFIRARKELERRLD